MKYRYSWFKHWRISGFKTGPFSTWTEFMVSLNISPHSHKTHSYSTTDLIAYTRILINVLQKGYFDLPYCLQVNFALLQKNKHTDWLYTETLLIWFWWDQNSYRYSKISDKPNFTGLFWSLRERHLKHQYLYCGALLSFCTEDVFK